MSVVIEVSSTLLSFFIWRLLYLVDKWLSALFDQSEHKEQIMLCLYLSVLGTIVVLRIWQTRKSSFL